MCYERMRRRDEAEEGRELWRDFERTRPVDEPEVRLIADDGPQDEPSEEIVAPAER